ncbi:MAG: glycosyltransferase, partial [Caulobacteraceae bacterium]|nr:glycosyltransferase [Caulobacteraceae bacterium]
MAEAIARKVAAFAPDLVLAVGGFHVPLAILERLRALKSRPPVVAWVGDAFDAGAAPVASLYDLVGHTDSDLLGRHRALRFEAPALWLPHGADPSLKSPAVARSNRIVFVGAATPGRRALLERLDSPIDLYGPGWRALARHPWRRGRTPKSALPRIYAGHLASLNIRNEANVLAGLNQRSFEPYLYGAAVVSDAQPDLERCFEPGREVNVWRDPADLGGACARLTADPDEASRVAAA